MLVIIMSHFGVHGIFHVLDPAAHVLTAATFSWQMVFTQFVCWGGGMGNAVFVLITGYFMIGHAVHWRKLVLLLLAQLFYAWLIAGVVYGGHFLPYTMKDLVKESFPIFFGGNWFVSCYIVFSLFIPFINSFLTRLTKPQYQGFLLLLFAMFSVLPTFKIVTFFSAAPIVFFFLVYACGGYLKLYGKERLITGEGCHRRYLKVFFALLAFLLFSIAVSDAAGLLLHKDGLLTGAARFTQVLQIPMAISLFLYFLTRPYFYHAQVNRLAGTVLGIYLIHDNDLMRKLLWDYIFPNLDFIQSPWYALFYLGKVLAVFAVCSLVELLRKRCVERPLSAALERRWADAAGMAQRARGRLLRWAERV